MNINGWDISGAQAKQWNVTPGFSDIENESEWQRGSPLPFFINGSIGWKTIRITFLVYGSDRNEILQNCSTLLSHMMSESVTLELDKFDHKFCGFMSKHDFTENPLAAKPFRRLDGKLIRVIENEDHVVHASFPPTGQLLFSPISKEAAPHFSETASLVTQGIRSAQE